MPPLELPSIELIPVYEGQMSTNLGSSPTGPLTLTYYGHSAFKWQTEAGLRVLTDPYRNREDRYWFTR